MKRIIAILAALATLGLTVPTDAEAGHTSNRRVVSYTACGRPIYATYCIIGFDRCGNPIGQWVTETSRCGCSKCRPRVPSFPGQRHHHHDYCPPSFGFGGSSGGFFFRFGR